MDGKSRMVLHRTNMRDTYTITMDYENQVLYWADYTLNRIESSNVDGSNRRVLSTAVRDPYAMAYYNGRLYWGDFSLNRVLTGPVTSPGSGMYLGGSVSYDVFGIHIVSREAQPLGLSGWLTVYMYHLDVSCIASNPCSNSNGNCTHLCLLSSTAPAAYGCECPTGMLLAGDGRTCSCEYIVDDRHNQLCYK